MKSVVVCMMDLNLIVLIAIAVLVLWLVPEIICFEKKQLDSGSVEVIINFGHLSYSKGKLVKNTLFNSEI